MFCPKCRDEFREGYVFCRKCNTDLVDELQPFEVKKQISYTQNPDRFLISVFDDNEAKIVESLLRAYDIPVLRRYNGFGHYFLIYWGFTVFGIEIYVPDKAFEFAQEILENKIEEEEIVITNIERAESKRFRKSYQKKRGITVWVFILVYCFGGFGLLVMGAYIVSRLVYYRKKID